MRAILLCLAVVSAGLPAAARAQQAVAAAPEAPGFEQRLAALEAVVAEREREIERLKAEVQAAEQLRQQENAGWQERLSAASGQNSAAVQQAEAALAEARSLRSLSKKELRLAKESLGRALQLIDEAKLRGREAGQAMAEANRRAEAAWRAEVAWQAAEQTAARRESELAGLRHQPVIIYGGYSSYGRPSHHPARVSSGVGEVLRVPRSGTGSDLPSPISGIPVGRR
jgi:hypothetical protein